MARGFVQGAKKLGRGIVQAPGFVVGASATAATTIVGGAVRSTGRGMSAGSKAVKNMRTRIVGEGAEEAAKGTKYTKNRVIAKNNADVHYSTKDGKHYRQVGDYEPVELTDEQYRMHLNGQDAELAAQLAEMSDGWSLGNIKEWASENQGIALGIAGGIGLAGGALLFDDDEY